MRDWGLGAFDYCTPRFFFVSLGFSRARVLLRRLIVFSAIDQLSATHSIWKSSFDSATGSLLMRVQLRCPYVKLKCEILHDLIICSGVRGMPPREMAWFGSTLGPGDEMPQKSVKKIEIV